MNKLILVTVLLMIVGCGGSSGNVASSPEGITSSQNDTGLEFKANFESLEGDAFWMLEIFDSNENSLGNCEFEKRKKTDSSPIYFKDKSVDPICSGVEIDPSSTVDNLKISNDFDLIKYCLVDNGVKKCGEVRK